MHHTKSDIDELKMLIQQAFHHTYIEKYIGKPQIDEEKLYILHYLMQNISLAENKKKRFIVTTTLVQLALDTHDQVLVKNRDAKNENEAIALQLSVLAGDYYSGLYYRLLAEIGEIGLISTLATAIKRINEAKMKLYYHDFQNEQELIGLLKIVHAGLYVAIAEYINTSQLTAFIEDWLLANFLHQNRHHKQLLLEHFFNYHQPAVPVNTDRIYEQCIADAMDNITNHSKDLQIHIQSVLKKWQ